MKRKAEILMFLVLASGSHLSVAGEVGIGHDDPGTQSPPPGEEAAGSSVSQEAWSLEQWFDVKSSQED